MRRLLIVVVVGTVLAVAGLVTAALIRQTEPAAPAKRDPPAGWMRVASGLVSDLVALVTSPPRHPPAARGPASLPTPADSEPRFAYRVVGGFSGEGGDDVTITSTGKVILVSPREPLPDSRNISSSQVAKLTDLFNQLDFMHMRTTPELNPPCPDGFSSLVTYRSRGLMNTVEGGMFGERKHPFWRCYGALANVVSERRRAVGERTLADSPARIDSITVDGKPVTANSTVVVDSRKHRISWRGVAKEGRTVTGFAIAIRRDYGHDGFVDYTSHCPTGDYDYTFPVPGGPYYVTPVVYFSDNTYSWVEFEVIPEQSVGGMDRLMLNPHGRVTVLPKDRWKESERNRVTVAVDGRPVARHDTVRVRGGRSHRISWRGIGAGGCKPLRLMIGIQARRNGRVLDRADNCPDGYHDFTFPVSSSVFWVIPEAYFTDYTWAWGDFFVTTSEQP